MSRRTPVKELLEEESTAPMSPRRRSTRIATTRRNSTSEDTTLNRTTRTRRLSAQDDDASSTSSSVSSSVSKQKLVTRASSKSPSALSKADEVNDLPVRRTRGRGSISSLTEEDTRKEQRVGSPAPAKMLTRKSFTRSANNSPEPLAESLAPKAATPRRSTRSMSTSPTSEVTKPATPKPRGRRPSVTDKIIPLESIEENKKSVEEESDVEETQDVIEETQDESSLFKKKKTAMMLKQNLQTITEKSFIDEDGEGESASNVSKTENVEKIDENKLNTEKDENVKLNNSIKNSNDSSIVEVSSPEVDVEKKPKRESNSAQTPEKGSKVTRLSLSLLKSKESPHESTEDEEPKLILNSEVSQKSPSKSMRLSKTAEEAAKETNEKSLILDSEVNQKSPRRSLRLPDTREEDVVEVKELITNSEMLQKSPRKSLRPSDAAEDTAKEVKDKSLTPDSDMTQRSPRRSPRLSDITDETAKEGTGGKLSTSDSEIIQTSPRRSLRLTDSPRSGDTKPLQACDDIINSDDSFSLHLEISQSDATEAEESLKQPASEKSASASLNVTQENGVNTSGSSNTSDKENQHQIKAPTVGIKSASKLEDLTKIKILSPSSPQIKIVLVDALDNKINLSASPIKEFGKTDDSPSRQKSQVVEKSFSEPMEVDEYSCEDESSMLSDKGEESDKSRAKDSSNRLLDQEVNSSVRETEGKNDEKLKTSPNLAGNVSLGLSESSVLKSDMSHESLEKSQQAIATELDKSDSPLRRSARLLKLPEIDTPKAKNQAVVNSTPNLKSGRKDAKELENIFNDDLTDVCVISDDDSELRLEDEDADGSRKDKSISGKRTQEIVKDQQQLEKVEKNDGGSLSKVSREEISKKDSEEVVAPSLNTAEESRDKNTSAILEDNDKADKESDDNDEDVVLEFSLDSDSDNDISKSENNRQKDNKSAKQMHKSTTDTAKSDEDDYDDSSAYLDLDELQENVSKKLLPKKTNSRAAKDNLDEKSSSKVRQPKKLLGTTSDSETDLDAKIDSLIAEHQEDDSDGSSESALDYLDDMAEEGEEDTPSEGSNDIIDLGESVGSSESEVDSDETYENDSFIADEDEPDELLSGEEYDLGQEKREKKKQHKRKRIIEPSDSEQENKENESPVKAVINAKQTQVTETKEKSNGKEEDSDLDKMSTQPYCGTTPPSVISMRDSLSDSEKTTDLKEDGSSSTSVLINKEDNLKSLEELKQTIKTKWEEIVVPPEILRTPKTPQDTQMFTPNNSILEDQTTQSSNSRKRHSSITIHENVKLKDIQDLNISDRFSKAVDFLCSTNDGKNQSGNVAVNISVELLKSPSSSEESDDFQEKVPNTTEAIKQPITEIKSSLEDQIKLSAKKEPVQKLTATKISKSFSSDRPKRNQKESLGSELEDEDVTSLGDEQAQETLNKSESLSEEFSAEKKLLKKERKKKKREAKAEESVLLLDKDVQEEEENKSKALSGGFASKKRITKKERKNKTKLELEDEFFPVFSSRGETSLEELPTEQKLSKKDRKKKKRQQKATSLSSNSKADASMTDQSKEYELVSLPKKSKLYEIPSILVSSDSETGASDDLDEIYQKYSNNSSNYAEISPKKSKKKKSAPKLDTNDDVTGELVKKVKKRKRDPNADLMQETHDVEIFTKPKKKKKSMLEVVTQESNVHKKLKKPKTNTLNQASSNQTTLSKNIGGKSKLVNIVTNDFVEPCVSAKSRKKKTKHDDVGLLKAQQQSDVKYFPSNILSALTKHENSKRVVDVVNLNQPLRKPRLVPSTGTAKREWEADVMDSALHPSSSNKKMKADLDFYNVKDFRNKMLTDPNRVKRVDTKLLLKKKQKMKN